MAQNTQETQETYAELVAKAREYALDLERHIRHESGQGQLSPTDIALFSRIIMFLRYQVAEDLTGDPEAFSEN